MGDQTQAPVFKFGAGFKGVTREDSKKTTAKISPSKISQVTNILFSWFPLELVHTLSFDKLFMI